LKPNKNRKGFFFIFKRFLSQNQARPAHAVHCLQDSEAGQGVAPARCSGANRACGNGGTHTQSGLHGPTRGVWLRHEQWQGLHREHPRCMANLPDMVQSSNLKRGRRATEGAELTGARRWCRAAPVVGEVGHASGSCSEVIRCYDHASGSWSEVIGCSGHASGSCSKVIRCSRTGGR
jgi:hypothetical protein